MKLNLTLENIAKITNGKLVGDPQLIVDHIYTDSRKNLSIQNSAFIAIIGEYNNGHDFIVDAYSKGISIFIVEQTTNLPKNTHAVVVTSTFKALQELAQWHRNNFSLQVIGITGSYGKTIVKEWLYHCLSDNFDIVRSPKSYNSQIGVPLSVLEIRSEHTLGIFEAGISLKGEMQILADIIKPDISILTSIGNAHIENFSSQVELKKEKSILLESANKQVVFFPIEEIIHKETEGGSIISYNNEDYFIPFIDNGSIQNAHTVIQTLNLLNIDTATIRKKLKTLPSIALRLETKIGANNSIIVNDSDNTDLNALVMALDYLNKFDKSKQKVAILSDVVLDISAEEVAYSKIATILSNHQVKEFIGIGPHFYRNRHLFPNAGIYSSTEDFINDIQKYQFENKIILLKGGKSFHFNTISEILELKSHQTVLRIYLNNLLHNVNQYKQLLAPKTKLLCMIKAYGYGNGIKEIASFLNHHGANYFGVAYTDEGVFLRQENSDTPIIVMNPETTSFNDIIKFNLEPSIYNLKQLDSFIRHCIDLGITEYPIHIKIDTGMNRLGFVKNQVSQLLAQLKAQPEVTVKSIFSHLAVADDRSKDDFTHLQIRRFTNMANQVAESLGYEPMRHILNSKGLEHFPEAQFDMVRLGIGMYGVIDSKLNLLPVAQLNSVIVDIKEAKKGDCVGYGCAPVEKDTTIAILPIGYADGYNRKLSNGVGEVAINGKKAKTIGKISMDMLAIDVTGIDCKEGDSVELFGNTISISELANKIDTIPYEIMTGISSRVARVYIEE